MREHTSTLRIDLNSDLGEHVGGPQTAIDENMLGIVTSANVSCGFHAGNPEVILATLQHAVNRGVAVGAHVAYQDREGFGRRAMDPSTEELTAAVIYQIGALQSLAKAAGAKVRYVKPHGALYNTIAADERQAAAVIEAVRRVDPELPLVCLAASPLIQQVEAAGLRAVPEAFADRAYGPDGSLLRRDLPGAVLSDPDIVAERMLSLIHGGSLLAVDGTEVQLGAESICVHGDSRGAAQLAEAVRRRLTGAGITFAPFVEC